MNRQNAEYVDEMYAKYIEAPESVDSEWRYFFEGVDFAQGSSSSGLSETELKVYHLIDAYRHFGHLEADINPLTNTPPPNQQLSLKNFGLSEKDLKSSFSIGALIGLKNANLEQIIEKLRSIYCGKIAVQVSDSLPDIRDWFFDEFEKSAFKIDNQKKKDICHQLIRTESLEKFFHTRFVGQKRFSIEGADSLIPMLEHSVVSGTPTGIEEIVIGMAHRGRINVLANFMDKGLDIILAEFTGVGKNEPIEGYDSDVKYHLGYSSDKNTDHGNCHISLAFNPSHLEAVNPVVLGMARAKQRLRQDTQERKKVLPILIHGDAAFAGQGVVAETFQLSQVAGYTVGGTIHIIIDNQVGFTTSPESSRSSHYSSDTGKILNSPVLHVNGDDPEACVRAMDIAVRFRQKYKRDMVINLTCYRRYGHNEGDEPAFTQPLMYDIIKKHPTTRDIYGKKAVSDGAVTEKWLTENFQQRIDNLQQILEDVRNAPPTLQPLAFKGLWHGLRRSKPADFEISVDTKCSMADLHTAGKALLQMPENFTPHKKLKKLLDQRKKMIFESEVLDWGTAELLCYGSLILEGHSVRLSGQDCGRGTFTHRHCLYYDSKTGEKHNPLKELKEGKEFCVYDSILSEMAVVGFEYGNACVDPTFLTIWEAQFGDFANGAQIVIDQFLSSGESKWQRNCGLVMLLPHGYEGQGPEHSSARMERFLQLCAQFNMQVVNLTTPAQIFHALRRQMKRDFRKPLIVMSPKSLLRHPKAVSTMKSLAQGTFQEVIDDSEVKTPKKVDHVLFCSGKLFYELDDYRQQLPDKERFAIVRMEQIYPFPQSFLKPVMDRYPAAKTIRWVQEEPENMGSWQNVSFDILNMITEFNLSAQLQYIGRSRRASPATGTGSQHVEEQNDLIKRAFEVK